MGFGVFLVHPPMALVLLSASVKRCFVSRMRDFFLQSVEAYWWRVCYQRGLPRLVWGGSNVFFLLSKYTFFVSKKISGGGVSEFPSFRVTEFPSFQVSELQSFQVSKFLSFQRREGGRTNERLGTDHVISGPMRGLEKTAPNGPNRHPDRNTDMATL